jgi:hypothetical protein
MEAAPVKVVVSVKVVLVKAVPVAAPGEGARPPARFECGCR